MGLFIGIGIGVMVMILIYLNLWPRLVLSNLFLERQFSTENCYVGDQVDFQWKIGNRGKLPLSWIRLETEFPTEMEMANVSSNEGEWVDFRSILSIGPSETYKVKYNCCFKQRGYYLFKDVRYDTTDHLGKRKYSDFLSDKAHIFVYPKRRPINELIQESQLYNGSKEVRRWVVDDPLIAIGSREYTSTDPMKYVDWNGTAKLGQMQVKKFSYTTERATMFLLNAQTKDYFWEGTEHELLEQMVETIAAYVSVHEKGAESYGLSSNCPIEEGAGGLMIQPARGRKHYHKVFRALTQMTNFIYCPFEEVVRYNILHNQPHTRMVLISGIINQELIDCILDGMRKGFQFEVITSEKMLKEWGSALTEFRSYRLKEAAYEA